MGYPVPGPTGVMVPGGVTSYMPGVMATGYAAVPLLGTDQLALLASLKGVFIQQKIDLLDVLTGCESQQQYSMFPWDPILGADTPSHGKSDLEVVRFKEKSNFCVRQLCQGARPFDMAMVPVSPAVGTFVQNALGISGDPHTHTDGIVLERPFKCTFFCLARPVMYVRHNALGYIGEIYNPFKFFNHTFYIRSPTPGEHLQGPIAAGLAGPQQHWYTVRGSICQPAAWCFLPMGECAKYMFQIFKPDDVNHERPVGYMARIWAGCVKQVATDADNYVVEFPADSTPFQKATLTSLLILIDMLYFQNTQSADQRLNNDRINFNASF
jgi:Scramblase